MGKFNIYVCVIKLGGKRSEEKRLLLIVGVATILLGACSENKPTKQYKEQVESLKIEKKKEQKEMNSNP
ncbi:hypothetical protein CN315_19610 [Bacillus cereus]|nr:hypothetical protein CN315_19610 [Bacillus cereus]